MRAYVSICGLTAYLRYSHSKKMITKFHIDSKATGKLIQYAKTHDLIITNLMDGQIWIPLTQIK